LLSADEVEVDDLDGVLEREAAQDAPPHFVRSVETRSTGAASTAAASDSSAIVGCRAFPSWQKPAPSFSPLPFSQKLDQLHQQLRRREKLLQCSFIRERSHRAGEGFCVNN
jgi:hypothetical protein